MQHKKVTTKRKASTTKKASTTTQRKKTATTNAKRTSSKKSSPKHSTTKYGSGSQNEVKKEMHKFKKGTAKSGKTGTPVKSREQAIAIGLSKARKKGIKVPSKK